MNDQPAPESEKRPLGTCANCFFSQLSPIDPNTMQRLRYCKFMPPTGAIMQTSRGVAQAGIFPPVQDDFWCWQWKADAAENHPGIQRETPPKLLSS